METRVDLARDGYVAPIPLFTAAECRRIAAYLRRDDLPEPAVWEKGRAVSEPFLFELATRPAVLEPVTAALGSDVVLWGVSAVSRAPRQRHAWHSDIESCAISGGFTSVWVGVENTSNASLQLVARSQLLGMSVQEARAAHGLEREEATPEDLLSLARTLDHDAKLVQLDLYDGEAVVFDGRLWHGSDNRRRRGERTALLLQFAAADRPVRIPDWSALDWPFVLREEPRPPVIVVSGTADEEPNRVTPPPPPSGEPIGSAAHSFQLFAEDLDEPWQPFPALRGATPLLDELSCHASVLAGGHSPHPPHAHVEEELLLPLHGEVELVIADGEDDPAPRLERALPGSFVYYPSGQHHTIRNPGTTAVAYLMLKWRGAATEAATRLGTQVVSFGDEAPSSSGGLSTRVVLEGATGCLRQLHAHVSVLQPGAGYPPHRDPHDLAIVTLEGSVETLGRTVPPTSVVYCGAGELHGMRNPSAEPARYLVFEFHRPPRPLARRPIMRRIGSRLRRARAVRL